MARPITLADRSALAAGLPPSAQPPAEYAFANLYLFRDRHRYRIVDGPIPHLSGITYDGMRHALPLGAIDRAGADILLDTHDCLFPFGAEGDALAGRLGLACGFASADSDYVFDADALASLAGAKMRRAQARAFAEVHAPVAQPVTPALATDLNGVLDGWHVDVGRDAAATDLVECREAIATLAALGLEGTLVRTGAGVPAAFLLASRLGEEVVVHFAKGRRAYDGAYPFLFAHHAAMCGAARLNFEQDLGNPGFAQSKRAYAPLAHRPKYRLTRP